MSRTLEYCDQCAGKVYVEWTSMPQKNADGKQTGIKMGHCDNGHDWTVAM